MKKGIAISAINLYEGGTLSVLKDCLFAIENSTNFHDYDFIVLVHKKELFNLEDYKKITFKEFPKSRKSYVNRLYYEYFYFKMFAKKNEIFFWFSIHDMTPNVGTIRQAVYCHNPSPFKKISLKDLLLQPTVFLFTLFYSYLYKINIKKNKYVVVQQLWLKDEFYKRYKLKYEDIIIAKPQEPQIDTGSENRKESDNKLFVYPTYPRSFKNIEVIGEAVKILNKEGIDKFQISVTIDGTENKYSKMICDKYGDLEHLNFIGLQPRETVYKLYQEAYCLIFPSQLETWGLPISEFKQFDKPILLADLVYAKETVGFYEKAKFFNPSNAEELASYIKQILSNELQFDETKSIAYPKPYVENWEDLLLLMIKEEDSVAL